jgi:hypothetical protein
VKALATQYLQYGRWRREIMRQHPQTVSVRYLAPPAAVVGLAGSALFAAVGALAGWKHAWLGIVPSAAYAGAVTAGGWVISRGEPASVRVRVPVALATMHMSWGVGFLTSPRDLRP